MPRPALPAPRRGVPGATAREPDRLALDMLAKGHRPELIPGAIARLAALKLSPIRQMDGDR